MTHLLDATTYDPDDEVNLTGYADSMAVYVASVTGLLALGRATGRQLPEHYSLRDLTLGGIATHKLTRLLSRASVTSPLRAPFTQFEEAAGSGEHVEKPRDGHGVRHTVGELLTCPFCLAQWVATGLVMGYATAPRATRLAALTMTMVAGSDVLQFVYDAIQKGVLTQEEPEDPGGDGRAGETGPMSAAR
jgi:hypothetical protein